MVSVIFFFYYLPALGPRRTAAGQRACVFPVATTARQSFGSCAAQNGISSLAGSRISGRELDLLLPHQPTKKNKNKSAHAHTHIHEGELLNFGIMPAIDGHRMFTFEDDERESEYGYVRKVGMQYVFCACAFASYIVSSVSNTKWKIGH